MNGLHVTAPFALVVALASSLSGGAPATQSGSAGSLRLAGYERVQDRNCHPAAFPKALPPADAIVNVGALQRAIAADSVSRPSSDVTFSLRFAQNGQAEWLKPIGGTEPEGHARLQAMVAAHTRPQAAAKEPWNVRLQVIAGDSSRYVVSRSHACPVEWMAASNPTPVSTGLGMASMDDIRSLRPGGESRVVVDVGPTGRILEVKLVRSSGIRTQDDFVLQAAREARYHPAIVDGIPIVGRFEHRMKLEVRTRTTRVRVN